jgi:hypothetical protein
MEHRGRGLDLVGLRSISCGPRRWHFSDLLQKTELSCSLEPFYIPYFACGGGVSGLKLRVSKIDAQDSSANLKFSTPQIQEKQLTPTVYSIVTRGKYGQFLLRLPPGTYEVEFVEASGKRSAHRYSAVSPFSQRVTIESGQTTTVEFKFTVV